MREARSRFAKSRLCVRVYVYRARTRPRRGTALTARALFHDPHRGERHALLADLRRADLPPADDDRDDDDGETGYCCRRSTFDRDARWLKDDSVQLSVGANGKHYQGFGGKRCLTFSTWMSWSRSTCSSEASARP